MGSRGGVVREPDPAGEGQSRYGLRVLFDRLGLNRAKEDIAQGRLWKARDRLTGLLSMYPAEQPVLHLLGEVHFMMGDLPAAGRYWVLTDRQGDDVDAALEALHERFGEGVSLAQAIPIRAPLALYPPIVQERLGEDLFLLLHPRARDDPPPGLSRGPLAGLSHRPYTRFDAPSRRTPYTRTKFGQFASTLGGLTAAVVLIGGWIVGVATVSAETDGAAWVPIIIFGGLATGAAWLDTRLRRRRDAKSRRAVIGKGGRDPG